MNRGKRILVVGMTIAVLAVGSVMALGADNGWWMVFVTEQSMLPVEVQEVVLEKLLGAEGEYAAYAIYAAILEEYGEVKPFSKIIASAAKHIDELKHILDQYEILYPVENPYLGGIQAPESLASAAQAAVNAKIAEGTRYERQLEILANYSYILEEFVSFQTASQEKHLPAFQRAAARY